MSAEFESALAALPHGPEFRFLDRLVRLEPGRSGAGEFTLRGDEAFVAGHFPGEPLLPGVLLIEAGAQLGGVVAQSDPALKPLAGLKLTGVRGVKFPGAVRPREVIEIEARVLARMEGLVQIGFTARVRGELVAQGEVTLAGQPA